MQTFLQKKKEKCRKNCAENLAKMFFFFIVFQKSGQTLLMRRTQLNFQKQTLYYKSEAKIAICSFVYQEPAKRNLNNKAKCTLMENVQSFNIVECKNINVIPAVKFFFIL